MSGDSDVDSDGSLAVSSSHHDANATTQKQSSKSKKKNGKAAKSRLTASQKNLNHKEAEERRRGAIREALKQLSQMIPGAEGHERSEQVMIIMTSGFIKEVVEEQRRLEQLADQRGVSIDEKKRLRDDDYGGPNWRQPNLDAYNATKAKRQKNDPNDQ